MKLKSFQSQKNINKGSFMDQRTNEIVRRYVKNIAYHLLIKSIHWLTFSIFQVYVCFLTPVSSCSSLQIE